MKKKIFFFLLAASVIFQPVVSWAASGQLKATDGFERYKFGSVIAQIYPDQQNVKPGSKLDLQLDMKNANDYPIVDGTVYIKIYRERVSTQDENVNYFLNPPSDKSLTQGDFLVDQFAALDRVSLAAKEEKTADVEYSVPQNWLSGEYKIVSYFVSDHKFNLLGLSFLDDIVGNTAYVTVDNAEARNGVGWDKDQVKVNGADYDFVGYSSLFGENDEVKMEIPLINSTDKAQTADLSWDLYYWDGLSESNRIKSEQESVSLNPGETKIVSHIVSGNNYPVNFLVARADWQDAHSILTFRFSRDTAPRVRNNFMGLTKFPLLSGQSATVFATAHAVTEPLALDDLLDNKDKKGIDDPNYQMVFTLKDKDQKEIASWQYNGPIQGEISGYEADFVPHTDYNFAVLEAVIKDKDGNVVDKSSLTYDCSLIDPASCTKETVSGSVVSSIKGYLANPIVFGTLITVIGILIIIFYVARRRKAGISIIVFLVASASLLGGVRLASAGTMFGETDGDIPSEIQTESDGRLDLIAPKAGGFQSSPSPYEKQTYLRGWLSDRAYTWDMRPDHWDDLGRHPWTTINFVNAWVRYSAWSSVPKNQTQLKEGDVFYVEDRTHHEADSIFWHETSYNIDSPYGCWADDPATVKSSSKCYQYIYHQAGKCLSLQGMVAFRPPVVNIDTAGPVDCKSVGYDRWQCKVTGAGNVRVNLVYKPTSGQFRYISNDSCGGGAINDEFQSKLNCNATARGKIVQDLGTCSNVVFRDDSFARNKQCQTCDNDVNGLNLPEVSRLAWSYQAVASNKPPTDPICVENGDAIRCPSALKVDQNGNFIFKSTDPDGDKIQYKIDWGDGSPIVTTGFLASGQSTQLLSHSWSSIGKKTIKVLATDEHNLSSAEWQTFPIVISDQTYSLSVSSTCLGNITSTPAGIDCRSNSGSCSEFFPGGVKVTLRATPSSGGDAGDWSGDCSGTDSQTCVLTMTENKNVTAGFICPCIPKTCNPEDYCQGDVCVPGCEKPNVPGTKVCKDWREVAP